MGNKKVKTLDDLREHIANQKWYSKFYYWLYRNLDTYSHLQNLYRNTKYFIQRGRRGWSNRDVWSFDWYIAGVITEAVAHLKKTTHGFPANLTEEKWNEILDEIIYAFKILRDRQDLFYEACEEYGVDAAIEIDKENRKSVKKGMALFIKNFDGLWD